MHCIVQLPKHYLIPRDAFNMFAIGVQHSKH